MSTEFEERVSKQTQIYRKLGQGIKVFYDQNAEVDILAVPGLGTNPEECWTWNPGNTDGVGPQRKSFNWIRDPDGLARLFPKSRIMLYDYASAWREKRKVRATMKSICTILLDVLKEYRKGDDEVTRPLIMIGHSMGGIVVAKALCIAKARREFEAIVTCTMGCLFFGAPFRGSNMAKMALLYSSVFGNEAYDALLSFMRAEKNDVLDEVTNDFLEISNKLMPPTELYCAWEQVPTHVSYSERTTNKLPTLMQHKVFKTGAKVIFNAGIHSLGGGTHFVEKESATLQGHPQIAMTAGHSDLIRFDSVESEKFAPVRIALTNMVSTARTNIRKRTSMLSQNLLSPRFINQVRQSLEGVDMRSKYRANVKQREVSTWLVSESLYKDWVAAAGGTSLHSPYLWLKGGPGLGKTNACLTAIQQITQINLDRQTGGTAQDQVESLLAFFLCDWSSGCCTAEDLLKSIITQIINQEESLAHHARWFIPNPRYRGPASDEGKAMDEEVETSGAKATATVENLWKCLSDMMDDPILNSIHIIISNIHCLDASDSTTALLTKLRENAFSVQGSGPAGQRAKWLLTSRNDVHISNWLSTKYIPVIDLENDLEYGAKVRQARQKHAREAIQQLRSSKKYSLDLAYYVQNSIERQSEDDTWTDVLCILLKAKPTDSSFLEIKNWLKGIGRKSIHLLIDHAWDDILRQNEMASSELEEIIQVLTIAYEPPTLAELAVLTDIRDSKHLADLIEKCSPILQIGEWSEHKERVIFTNQEFEKRLAVVCNGGLDPTESPRKEDHGVMALRCFQYIKSSYRRTGSGELSLKEPTSLVRSSTTTARLIENSEVLELTNEDDELDDAESKPAQTSNRDCFYPIKYLFRHLGDGPPDALHELYENDPDFWGLESRLRTGWLKDFQTLTSDLKDLNASGMSALHVAAAIGAKEVASLLVIKNGSSSLTWTNDAGMTALHAAANNNHASVVDVLLRAGADIEAGEGEAGTALHRAALRGNCAVMALLIDRKANVNAYGQFEKIGPVINAAIRSGSVDAVKQVMDNEVRFDLDYTRCDRPLSLSAGISEPSLFRKILETGRDKWLQNINLLEEALSAASYGGRLETVCHLLDFQHDYTDITLAHAVFTAATEKKWACVNKILEYAIRVGVKGHRSPADLDKAFYLAATAREEQLDVLEQIWSLTKRGVPQDVRDFSLYHATVLNKESTVVWLLETCEASANATGQRPGSINEEYTHIGPSSNFLNALNAASSNGNVSIVNQLIAYTAEINHEHGYSLHLAAREGNVEVLKALLEYGAPINGEALKNDELSFSGGSALQAACEHSRVAIVEVLLNKGANPNLGGGIPLSNPITTATQRGDKEIFKMLLGAPDIDVNVTGGEMNSTPLINAAANMSAECVELLVMKHADIDARDRNGDTALIMAAGRGDRECIDMLCDNGADVTYRSPGHGLAIQVAAGDCAQFLAEKMGERIEDYREQAKMDPSRDALEKTRATLKDREKEIEELEAHLSETKERLENAKSEIDFKEMEMRRIVSENSYRNEAYESRGQQVKAMENERIELRKQLDASKGTVELADATIAKLRTRLDDQAQVNEALRTRKGFAMLEEEKQIAVKRLATEQAAANERSQREQQEKEQLQNQILTLQKEVLEASRDANAALLAQNAADENSEIQKQQKEEAQIETKTWQLKCQELEGRLETVYAAAGRNVRRASGKRTTSDGPENSRQSYWRGARAGSMSETKVDNLNEATGSPVGSPQLTPRNVVPVATPPTSPPPTSAGGEVFKTVHGIHRADGSLGGYRPGSGMGMRRTTSDLPSNGAGGSQSDEANSTARNSLYEDQPIQSDSPKSTKDRSDELGHPTKGVQNGVRLTNGRGANGWPESADEVNRVRWA